MIDPSQKKICASPKVWLRLALMVGCFALACCTSSNYDPIGSGYAMRYTRPSLGTHTGGGTELVYAKPASSGRAKTVWGTMHYGRRMVRNIIVFNAEIYFEKEVQNRIMIAKDGGVPVDIQSGTKLMEFGLRKVGLEKYIGSKVAIDDISVGFHPPGGDYGPPQEFAKLYVDSIGLEFEKYFNLDYTTLNQWLKEGQAKGKEMTTVDGYKYRILDPK